VHDYVGKKSPADMEALEIMTKQRKSCSTTGCLETLFTKSTCEHLHPAHLLAGLERQPGHGSGLPDLPTGKAPHPELAAYWSATPFRKHQPNPKLRHPLRYAGLGCGPFHAKKRQSPDDSRMFAAQFISVPSSVNQLRFITEYADGWQTNWRPARSRRGAQAAVHSGF